MTTFDLHDASGRSFVFSVSETALAKIAEAQLGRTPAPVALRLGVRGGGCSGFSYVIEWADEIRKHDTLVTAPGGVSLVIDAKSAVLLNGMTLEWEKTLLNKGFKFVNPNEKSRCGCGHSFQT